MRLQTISIIEEWCCVEADAGPITEDVDDNLDLDYFDLQDLGRLRRRLRTGIEGFQRERELYLELVRDYLEVTFQDL